MAKTKGAGFVKRYGVRYGKRVKDKVDKIYSIRLQDNKCPYCKKPKAKRVAVGIWFCGACKSKFTGGAYSVGRPKLAEKETRGIAGEPRKIAVEAEVNNG